MLRPWSFFTLTGLAACDPFPSYDGFEDRSADRSVSENDGGAIPPGPAPAGEDASSPPDAARDAAALATIVFVGRQVSGSSSSAAVTLALPGGVSAGDFLVAAFTTDSDATVTPPAGWTPIVAPLKPDSSTQAYAYYHLVQQGEAAGDPVWSLGNAYKWGGGVAAYRGVDGSRPLDVASPSTKIVSVYTETSITAPGVTTSTDGAMLIGGLAANGSSVDTSPPGGWTEAFDSAGFKMSEQAYRPQPTAGATGPVTWTIDAPRSMAIWVTALRPRR